MSGTEYTSSDLDPRQRKVLFRCWHRGMREVDLLLGHYANAHLHELSASELDTLEALMEEPDSHIFHWFSVPEDVPPQHDTNLLRQMRDFHLNSAKAILDR